jgi:hypothetical protein
LIAPGFKSYLFLHSSELNGQFRIFTSTDRKPLTCNYEKEWFSLIPNGILQPPVRTKYSSVDAMCQDIFLPFFVQVAL